MDAGYRDVHLANPSAIKQYEGLKYSDDQHDAFYERIAATYIITQPHFSP
jgi:hypothetical protein